ncbi:MULTISPECIES: efflux transporter outer membrane subunit [unclassified Variovorax]|uniref:efflux transporter outer membrane subunit n=1 Tax=unclassified Variovorax TaxID=663243 RepID=UPI00076D24A8|nr:MULTISPECIES: efflux transporter outer membrane subunit [unclassified Variovorax]KWT85154.1 RND efflux system, outer membrane lipoprotein CmeC [Variovorax sp. WDL1]PNG56589.1 Toluene efflux pump outer membrane protein TtgI [Variovorax sp. B4]PNG58013.1 Toluene efflux pump outer membrane protein TtgI [Variovorax sp. B2]VTV09508.1 Toluene efflux pump outer membrane protein TtgI precursor [Variovorax sp. WDL1]
MKLDRSTFTRPWRAALAPLMAALVLAGCATATPEAPSFQAPAQFKEQAAAPAEGQWTRARPAEAQPRGEWWRAFNDPVLDALVARADASNNSIQVAAARLAEARALARSTDADRSPQIGLGAGASRQRGLDRNQSTTPSTLINAGLDFSYELDLFGRLSKASDAARLDAESRAGLLQSTRLLVQAETAQTYLALRALDDERQLVRETVEAYRDTLRLTQQRHRAGDIAELDVARVETEMASTESEALTLDRRRAELEHALAVLTGEPASSFEMKPDSWATALPSIPAGVPATVLTRRPDVSAAQKGVLAAQARVGVAQAAWFPNIALTGGGGYASSEIGDLFKWSARSWGIGALLSLPLLDGGRREAGVQGASAQLDGALASYREQVLTAFRDVEDQLSSLRILGAQSEVQAKAVASASRATQLSDTRYRNGYISQLDLLDARRSELRNRRQALQVRSAQYQSTVGLIRALGGDWTV